MRPVRVRAPGKVMLSGEYAVLYGGPAVLVPVPRYISFTEIESPPGDPYPVAVQAALRHPLPRIEDFEKSEGPLNILIDDGPFYVFDTEGRRVKLGLGSSAAQVVGTVALRYERAGFSWSKNRGEIAAEAIKAHRRAQRGLGSGADVAACAYRVPIRFQLNGKDFTVDEIPPPSRENSLPLNLLWTGIPADTREMVDRFQRWAEGNPAKSGNMIQLLVKRSGNLANAWFRISRDEFFKALDSFDDALLACTESASLPYRVPGLAEIQEWARIHGGRARLTGAGGGDMILLIGDLPLEERAEKVIPLEPWGFQKD